MGLNRFYAILGALTIVASVSLVQLDSQLSKDNRARIRAQINNQFRAPPSLERYLLGETGTSEWRSPVPEEFKYPVDREDNKCINSMYVEVRGQEYESSMVDVGCDKSPDYGTLIPCDESGECNGYPLWYWLDLNQDGAMGAHEHYYDALRDGYNNNEVLRSISE